ncbi:MAG: hypothetical protein CM15mP3_04190 [Candidatus Poseidoniales archaeon]|nr:MAG: hypothetical protein CM15mP3_04190 [Candidatus Poseidoniales archaeon]
MTKASTRVNDSQDMSWTEVLELSKSYLKIPLALLFIEAIYWFITPTIEYTRAHSNK